MNFKVKIAFVCVFIVACVVGAVNFGIETKYKNDLAALNETKDVRMVEYKNNKELALSYLKIYDIVNESSYRTAKNSLFNNFSDELQMEYFPTVNYEGPEYHKREIEVKRCIGTREGTENTFLVEYNLSAVNYNQDISNLITVKDGKITSVTRIR